MIASTIKLERRQIPRITVEPLAYIHLQPDNGGIVFNISEGGLCFHSTAPILQTGTIHFRFSERNHRIEGDGELAWTDETKKRGGLRFTNLPPEARQRICSWISQPVVPFREENAEPSIPLTQEIPDSGAHGRKIWPSHDYSAQLSSSFRRTKAFRLVSGFSGGLITGLLLSSLMAAAFFLHSYRRQLGESLIRLGEQLGARSQPGALLQQTQVAPARGQTALPAPIAAQHLKTAVPQLVADGVKPQPVKPETTNTASPVPDRLAPGTSPGISLAPPPVSLPMHAMTSNLRTLPDIYEPVTKIEAAKTASATTKNHGEPSMPSTSQMYFEVGKFKQRLLADRRTIELTQFGFPATVVQKGHLWTNFYSVLVGPYTHEEQAETAHKSLLSRGLKVRPFERGSRDFVLRPGLTLNRTAMPDGDCIITWESYVTHAKVKFMQHSYVLATVEGKWVKTDVRYARDAVVYRINADGSRTLLEIQFAGMDRTLVFAKSS